MTPFSVFEIMTQKPKLVLITTFENILSSCLGGFPLQIVLSSGFHLNINNIFLHSIFRFPLKDSSELFSLVISIVSMISIVGFSMVFSFDNLIGYLVTQING